MNPIQRVKRNARTIPIPERGRGGGRAPAFSYPVLSLPGVGRFPQTVDDFEPSQDAQNAAADAVGMPPDLMLKSYVFDRSRFVRIVTSNPIANIADQLILPQPDNYRTYLWIQNPSATLTLFVSFGSPISGANVGMALPPGYSSIVMDTVVSQDDIHVAASANGLQFNMAYSNKGAFTK